MRLPFFKRNTRSSANTRKGNRLPRTVRAPTENPYFNRRVQRRVGRILPFLAGGAALLAVMIAGILSLTLPGLRIARVEIGGYERVTREHIFSLVEDEYETRAFFLFPRRNYFLFRTEEVQHALNALPSVDATDISKAFPDVLTIRVSERQTAHQVLTNDARALIDDKGVAIEVFSGEGGGRPPARSITVGTSTTSTLLNTTSTWQIPDLFRIIRERSTSTYQTLYDTSTATLVAGEVIVPAQILEAIHRSSDLLAAHGASLKPFGAIYDRDRLHEVQILTGEGWRLILDPGFSLDGPLGSLQSLLNEKLRDRKGLEYIDLRYQDRVYYK